MVLAGRLANTHKQPSPACFCGCVALGECGGGGAQEEGSLPSGSLAAMATPTTASSAGGSRTAFQRRGGKLVFVLSL